MVHKPNKIIKLGNPIDYKTQSSFWTGRYENENSHVGWIKISKKYSKKMLDSYGDEKKRKILTAAINPLTFGEIVRICDIPRTSCYRSMLSLVKDGLLTTGNDKPSRIEPVKYMTTIELIRIEINRDKITIFIKPAI